MAHGSDRRAELEARIAMTSERIRRLEARSRERPDDVDCATLLETNRRMLAAAKRELESS